MNGLNGGGITYKVLWYKEGEKAQDIFVESYHSSIETI